MSSANIAVHNSVPNTGAIVPPLDEISKVDNLAEAVPHTIATSSDAANKNSVIPPPTDSIITASTSEAFQLSSNLIVPQTLQGNDTLHRSMESSGHTDKSLNSGTPLPEGENSHLPSNKQTQNIHNSSQDGSSNHPDKGMDVNVYKSSALVQDSNDIASDIQERSSLGDIDNPSKLDEDETTFESNNEVNSSHHQAQDISLPIINNNNTQITATDVISDIPTNGDESKTTDASTHPKPMSLAVKEQAVKASVPTENVPPQDIQVAEDMAEVAQESIPSYMSPNHEWARILQRRLGKGLSDAQMLARSNSMLASPSILAQSLTQVIPNLLVKDTGVTSPGSSNREYQTAEELFDRPASIAPSGPTFLYDDQTKDFSFPSSTLNNSQAPLLLFAPLNPDQLLGKKSSKQPSAPPAPSPAEKLSQPLPVSASASTQQKSQGTTTVLNSTSQTNVPIIPIPIPPIAVSSSPTPKAPVAPALAVETHHSPSVSREQGAVGTKLGQGQDEKQGVASITTSNPKMLIAQGSSASLSGTPSPLKDQPNVISNYPSHIQYTPVTTYKSTAKESAKPKKNPRDISNTSIDDSVAAEAQSQLETKDSIQTAVALTTIAPVQTVASVAAVGSDLDTAADNNVVQGPIPVVSLVDSTAEWAMEALSGFSDVNIDTTLNMSNALTTTAASTVLVKEAPANNIAIVPSLNGVTTIESSTKNATKIPSPFNSAKVANESDITTEPKSQPIQAPVVEPVQNAVPILPPSSAHIASTTSSSYPGTYQPITAQPLNYIAQDQANVITHQHGGRVMHQANRSISSLRDVQLSSPYTERGSQDFGHQRRNDLEYAQATNIPTPTVVPPSYNLGSAYQISWLPQSQPILPPRADINSIDVPELTEKQLVPFEPRSLEVDSVDPCFQFKHIGEAIRHWGQHSPSGNAFASINGSGVESGSWDWSLALGKAEMIAKSIHDKTPLRPGARVALVFRLSEILEFVAAFYGSILAGMVPVLINQVQDFSEMVYIMTSANVELALTTQVNHKSLLTDLRKGAAWPAGVTWWQTDKLETWTPKNQQERIPITENEYAYIEYTKSTAGELKGVAISHKGLIAQCQALYNSFSWRPALYRDKGGVMQTDPQLAADPTAPPANDRKKKSTNKRPAGTTMTWLEPRQQSGLILGAIMGVFCGSFTVFVDTSITTISGLWAHTVAMYRANIAFGDYTGIQKLLRNFKSNPQATITPVRPDLRFLHTVYVDAQYNNPVLNREFLDEFLYPLGMIPRQDSAQNRNVDDAKESSSNSKHDENYGTKRSDSGLITFLSLPEIGGMILALRDNMDPPTSVESVDLRKQYRKSTIPRTRLGSVDVSHDIAGTSNEPKKGDGHLQIPGSEQAASNGPSRTRGELLNLPMSSMTSGHYLLHRESLRMNRVVLLATGEEAFRRRDELGAILVEAFGYPIVQTTAFVVDPETLALSLPDVVGEIWASSPGMPVSFWGLPEHTQDIFNAKPYIVKEDTMIPSLYRPTGCDKILRTGLLGTIIEGRVVIFGSYWDRLKQDMADPMKPFGIEFEHHHCNDLINTLMTKVPGIGELSIFECIVNSEYLPVVCIELLRDVRWSGQNPNTVAQHIAVNSRHHLREVNGLRSYCIAVWDVNTLPRLFENGRRVVDHALCKRMFELGRIYKILYFGTFTDDVLFNIPRGDDIVNGFWSRECVAMRLRRQGVAPRYIQHTSNTSSTDALDERANVYMGRFLSISDVLIWRTIIQPDEIAFIDLDARGKEQKTITYKKFNHKVTGYAMHLEKKHGLKAGDHVILWFSQELDFVITLHACWVLGLIPIPLQLPESSTNANNHIILSGPAASNPHIGSAGLQYNSTPIMSTQTTKENEEKKRGVLRSFLRVADEVKVRAILGNSATDEFLKQKSTASLLRACRTSFTPNFSQTPEVFSSADIILPNFYNVSKATKSKQTLGILSGYAPRKEYLSANYPAVYLIDPEAKSGNIVSKKLLKLNHDTLNNLCRNQKLQFNALAGQPVVTSMSIFHGLGFVHGCLSGIYNGGSTIILQPADFYHNPMMWLEAVTRYKAQDISLTYPMLDHLLSRLDSGLTASNSISLEYIKNFMICNHGRVQQEKNKTAIGKLGALKLGREALNLIYSHPLNPMVTSQVDRSSGPSRIHVSTKSLRHGIVSTTMEADDPTGIWLEDTGVTTVGTSVAIVHPETFEVCAANQIGEIWVCSDSSVNAFYHPPGSSSGSSYPQPFNACISGYDPRYRYIRTGDLGFLWNGQQQLQMNQGIQYNQTGSNLYQLFVLGKLEESFQVQGLLHFAMDIETTVESSHANVAPQGCITFKTAQGVICVVKVQNQEPEVLVSMYIPIMHAILEQHQFLPDTIVLVGENVSTARRVSDGLKPRELICALYSTDRLPFLHLHHSHGNPPPTVSNTLLLPIQERSPLDTSASASPQSGRVNHPYAQQPSSQPQPQVSAPSSRILPGINPAPALPRSSTSLPPFSNGSPTEPMYAGSNRNSVYGSPLLLNNIPLPPGVHNPLAHAQVNNSPAPISYQPHVQYNPGSFTVNGPLTISTSHGHNNIPVSGPITISPTSRPISQGYVHVNTLNSGGINGVGGSSSSLLEEMTMYSGRSQSRQGQNVRQPHPRQIQGQEARSLSSEELRPDSKPGASVKNIMKGMKWGLGK